MDVPRFFRQTRSRYPLPAGILAFGVIFFLIASLATPVASQPAPMVKVLIGVTHQPGPSEEELVRQAGGQILFTYHLVPAIAALVPETAIPTLLANSLFTRVDHDVKVHATDLQLDRAWGVKRIGAGTVQEAGNKGTGVKVAVIDTGIDYSHPDLRTNFAGGRDFVNNDADPIDDNGHGTHVAGTIAARDNGDGVVGVAPEAQVFGLKVLGADGSGDNTSVIAALEWAVDHQIQVANMSFGDTEDPGPIAKAAFDNATAAGVLLIAAAGNDGSPDGVTDTVGFPARFDSVVSVAATAPDNSRAFFSSVGPEVRLAAPGFDIMSTFLGGLYAVASGTSMATPHVVGVAALVIGAGINDVNHNGRINDEVEQRLISSADDFGAAGRDTEFGFGVVDAPRAVGLPNPADTAPAVVITDPLFGATVPSGALIILAAAASDLEDGLLSPSLVWTSNFDGPIGSGPLVLAFLRDGSHTITAAVTDSAGKASSASVDVVVGAPSLPPLSVSVTSDRLAFQDHDTAKITALVTNETTLVPDARLVFVITTANGRNLFGATTTDRNGVARFQFPLSTSSGGAGLYALDATASREGFNPAFASITFLVR